MGLIDISPVVPSMSFFCSRIQPGTPYWIQLSCLLSLRQPEAVPQSFLIFYNLGPFEEYRLVIL